MASVLLIGTLDTKGTELFFVRDLLRAAGIPVTLLDAGVQPHGYAADLSAQEVFRAAGTSLEALRQAGDRGAAVAAAAKGAAKLAADLHARGEVAGVLALGGSAGTTIGTAAMRALPFGVPKLMVSTLASGQVRPYVGVRDVLMMNSVVDISGLNRVSRTVFTNAANAMIGMVSAEKVSGTFFAVPLPAAGVAAKKVPDTFSAAQRTQSPGADAPGSPTLVTATMFGVTTPCVDAARRQIEAAGFEVLVFHATGVGGQAMESVVGDGLVRGVLDITTTELADELVGGVLGAGPDRLTAAALRGVPQVISVGALDMVNFGPPETVPKKFRGRRFYQHNPTVTLMRTTPEENDHLGKEIAHKASAARGPTTVLVPLRGVSALDQEGGAFWWPEADRALFDSLRLWMSPRVKLRELDLHINDAEFARIAAEELLAMMK
jgi:uncharacterized protein (UPF0261 family)